MRSLKTVTCLMLMGCLLLGLLPLPVRAAGEAVQEVLSVAFKDLCVKGYDGTSEASPTLIATLPSGETIPVFYTQATYDSIYVGAGKTVTATGLSLSAEDSERYTLGSFTTVTGPGQITAQVVTFTTKNVQVAMGETLDLLTLLSLDITPYLQSGHLDCIFGFQEYALGSGSSGAYGNLILAGTQAGHFSVMLESQTGGDLNGDGKEEIILPVYDTITVNVVEREPQVQPGVSQPNPPEDTPTTPNTPDTSDTPSTPSTPTTPNSPESSQTGLVLQGPSSVTYGNTAQFTASGGAGTGAITYEVLPITGKASISASGVLTPIQAGKVRVSVQKAGDDRYLPLRADAVEVVIQPAQLTITVTSKKAQVGDPVPSLSGGYTVQGLVGSDKLATAPTLSYATTPNMSQSGSVTIRASGAVAPAGGNYNENITYVQGTLTIEALSTYAIFIQPSAYGQLILYQSTAQAGSQVTFSVKAQPGYVVESVQASAANGTRPTVTKGELAAYTFSMPASEVTLSANFRPEEPDVILLPFSDVREGDWFYESVAYVYERALMKGTSDSLFSPDETTTRGMIVTILYRLADSPEAPAWAPFSDVSTGAYYADPVAWAAWNGIVNGMNATAFAPESAITREQLAAIFYRYAGTLDKTGAAYGNLAQFQDVGNISAYAKEAMSWAVGVGLITGKGNGILDPRGLATRAQAAAMLQRFCETILG